MTPADNDNLGPEATARILRQHYGEEARTFARQQAEAAASSGISESATLWRRVLDAMAA